MPLVRGARATMGRTRVQPLSTHPVQGHTGHGVRPRPSSNIHAQACKQAAAPAHLEAQSLVEECFELVQLMLDGSTCLPHALQTLHVRHTGATFM